MKFSSMKSTPGRTPRVLSNRLQELEKDGMIERVEKRRGPNFVWWMLTVKGRDTIPVMMRFAIFRRVWGDWDFHQE